MSGVGASAPTGDKLPLDWQHPRDPSAVENLGQPNRPIDTINNIPQRGSGRRCLRWTENGTVKANK